MRILSRLAARWTKQLCANRRMSLNLGNNELRDKPCQDLKGAAKASKIGQTQEDDV